MARKNSITEQATPPTEMVAGTESPAQPAAQSEGTRGSRVRRRAPSKKSPLIPADTTSTLGASAYGDLGSFITQCSRLGMNKQAILGEVGQYVDHFSVTT